MDSDTAWPYQKELNIKKPSVTKLEKIQPHELRNYKY
jgi:hypothetical protein